ncbi:YheC/YheD family protein [Paenibacillus allorhizosphaerae]|uniref:Endospore coat-associated protein YheD n=1 Tax=Paenibacillus allorhizosphaerae TaxID=2849866 RepID=A0ABM8VMQ3_9BACL|nr:YheC/YheD family protein [Paenibacillus allorhizosphaerae]CAG7650200.1 Endospore coat-associated protein YheD [Paenibacillus allorhizosphaerae]
MKNSRNSVASKLLKARMLLQHPELAKHVPVTRPFTQSQLLEMLGRYGMVYVKPDSGSQGIGVVRVEKRRSAYRYQSGMNIYTFGTFQGMVQSLKQRIGSKRYLIQKGIHLLRYQGRPFDFRIMIQKSPARRWEPTGTAARLAHPQKAVTNGSQGGTIYAAKDLLKPFAGSDQTAELLRKMNRLARLTAARIGRTYPAMNELGIDIGIDRRLTPWILEVNTRPDPCPFTKLDDKEAIRKIITYAKAYGKRYPLVCNKSKKAPSCVR